MCVCVCMHMCKSECVHVHVVCVCDIVCIHVQSCDLLYLVTSQLHALIAIYSAPHILYTHIAVKTDGSC